MKTKQLIDRKRVLNLVTAAKIVSYAPTELVKEHPKEMLTDKVRINALNYLITQILNEIGLQETDVLKILLVHSINGEPTRFALEAVDIGLEFGKMQEAMKEDKQ